MQGLVSSVSSTKYIYFFQWPFQGRVWVVLSLQLCSYLAT